jgi:hypothetical protein
MVSIPRPSRARKFRRYRRKARKTNIRAIVNKTHMFKRFGIKSIIFINGVGSISSAGQPSTDSGLTLSSVTADSLTGCYQFGWSHQFALINSLQYNEFTQLFDKYKIVAVKYKIMYQCNQAAVAGSSVLPIIHYVSDSDDAAVPITYTDVTAKSSCRSKVLGNTQVVTMTIKPHVADEIYQSALTTAYGVRKAPYINTQYPSVPHYGVKVWMNNVLMAASNNTAITVEPTYILALRDVQ